MAFKLRNGLKSEKNKKVYLAEMEKIPVDRKRILFILLGLAFFFVIYYSPPWSPAIDPSGKQFPLSTQAKAALGLFLLAATWWVFEVVPIGVTALMIAVVQALFIIREPSEVFKDFMDPSVMFILSSVVVGLAFARTGLTKRMAYRMLSFVGEKTKMIYLGTFVMVMLLTLIMAHTAVAAAIFPLLMTIYSLYDSDGKQSKFGKGLFIGMAFSAGAGSIITLFGSARAAIAIGFFKQITGKEISFFELTYYMLPIGIIMLILIWFMMSIMYKPEKPKIPGLKDKVKILSDKLGPMSRDEKLTLVIVGLAIITLGLRSFIPAFRLLDKSGVMLLTTILFFVFKILAVKDLEEIPWNILLLFGGAMCIGICLWQTGAATWLAVNWLILFKEASWFVFVLSTAFFVLIMTNFIMNVAAIAITLPVALATCVYLGVAPEVVMFSCLVTAGMPFVLLIGAAPNAIAYESRQFSSREFLKAGIPMSIILMVVLGLFVWIIWPMMGMPVLLTKGV
jgi:solute carrier family 13 (sodium-dependent dicarboxylate transporter), member 2/3/5